MNKVLLIGTMPPPIGGVTIHIDRFLNLYGNKGSIELSVLDLKKITIFQKNKTIRNLFKIIYIFLSTDIIHIHVSHEIIKLIIAIICKFFFKKVVYTHHIGRVDNHLVFKLMYKVCDRIILVNHKEIKSNIINREKTEFIPAFLPPYKFDELPNEILININKYKKIISTNCFSYSLINKKHVYGYDLIINAFYLLTKENKIENTLLVLVDPSSTTKKYISNLLKNKEFGTNQILYITEKIDFVSLIKKSDVTIRATRTDGDSLSIRESLYFGIPVVCSDVTVRPENSILFKNEDILDLSNKILFALNNKEKLDYNNVNYGDLILKMYDAL